MVFRDNIVVFAQAGALPPAALEQVVAAARALDMDEVRREIAQSEGAQRPPRSAPQSGGRSPRRCVRYLR